MVCVYVHLHQYVFLVCMILYDYTVCSGMFICTCWWNSVSDVLLCVMVCAYVYVFEVYICADVVLMCVYKHECLCVWHVEYMWCSICLYCVIYIYACRGTYTHVHCDVM